MIMFSYIFLYVSIQHQKINSASQSLPYTDYLNLIEYRIVFKKPSNFDNLCKLELGNWIAI